MGLHVFGNVPRGSSEYLSLVIQGPCTSCKDWNLKKQFSPPWDYLEVDLNVVEIVSVI